MFAAGEIHSLPSSAEAHACVRLHMCVFSRKLSNGPAGCRLQRAVCMRPCFFLLNENIARRAESAACRSIAAGNVLALNGNAFGCAAIRVVSMRTRRIFRGVCECAIMRARDRVRSRFFLPRLISNKQRTFRVFILVAVFNSLLRMHLPQSHYSLKRDHYVCIYLLRTLQSNAAAQYIHSFSRQHCALDSRLPNQFAGCRVKARQHNTRICVAATCVLCNA